MYITVHAWVQISDWHFEAKVQCVSSSQHILVASNFVWHECSPLKCRCSIFKASWCWLSSCHDCIMGGGSREWAQVLSDSRKICKCSSFMLHSHSHSIHIGSIKLPIPWVRCNHGGWCCHLDHLGGISLETLSTCNTPIRCWNQNSFYQWEFQDPKIKVLKFPLILGLRHRLVLCHCQPHYHVKLRMSPACIHLMQRIAAFWNFSAGTLHHLVIAKSTKR